MLQKINRPQIGLFFLLKIGPIISNSYLSQCSHNSNLKASDGLQFKFAYDGEGNYGFLGADGSLIPFHKKALEYAYMYRISTNSYAGFIIDSNYTVISGDFGTQLSSGTALKITQNSSGSAISGLKAGRYNIYKNGVAIEENVYHDENTTLVYITSGYDKSNLYIAEYLGN